MPVVVTFRLRLYHPHKRDHPESERREYGDTAALPGWLRDHVHDMVRIGQVVRDTGLSVIQLQRRAGLPPPHPSFQS
ncbi:MAG: hypothetical protein M3R16_03610 [Pseudomonadota bacterium]|nr:hypothetical protein [Pseudomonadota bacterium]